MFSPLEEVNFSAPPHSVYMGLRETTNIIEKGWETLTVKKPSEHISPVDQVSVTTAGCASPCGILLP